VPIAFEAVKNRSVIVTTTFYKNQEELRYLLTCNFVKAVTAKRYKIIIVDCSPDPAIAQSFRALGAEVWPQIDQGLGASRRELFQRAGNLMSAINEPFFVLWVEPEKIDFANHLEAILAPFMDETIDLVMPKREEALYQLGYPDFQYFSEHSANSIYQRLFGPDNADPFFGPIAYKSTIKQYFEDLKIGDYGLTDDGYLQLYGQAIAKCYGAKTMVVEIPFHYPPDQKASELRLDNLPIMFAKRMDQLKNIAGQWFKIYNFFNPTDKNY
jgi:hypothetical protein